MTRSDSEIFRIAAVQACPVVLDREATVHKACELIAQAAGEGAKLVAFPECFVPTYPFWVWFIPPGDTHGLRALYGELVENAIDIPSRATDRLCEAAREASVDVVIGVNERNTEASGTTLFNCLVFIDAAGKLVGKQRKLIPTAGERLVHGRGDGSTFGVHDLSVGRVAGLICWECYMPLARYALSAWGTQILVAPTWDRGEPWISTLRHVAKEGRCYVLGCCTAMHRDDVPDRLPFKQQYLPPKVEWVNPGLSAIVDPDGKFLVEPVAEREEILYAEVDPQNFVGPRFQLDVSGHYGRPDVFQLTVFRDPRPAIREVKDEATEGERVDEDRETRRPRE